jgi:hypothetical protein
MMGMEAYEELQKQLAETVIWLRGEGAVCPFHGWVVVYIPMDPGGSVEPASQWAGPVCMMENQVPCDWQEHRQALVDSACEVLGTQDMTQFLP